MRPDQLPANAPEGANAQGGDDGPADDGLREVTPPRVIARIECDECQDGGPYCTEHQGVIDVITLAVALNQVRFLAHEEVEKARKKMDEEDAKEEAKKKGDKKDPKDGGDKGQGGAGVPAN